ncbi:aminotransferase class I/II-fold pyridoxal phosphate-dependent enzyme [Pseudomonas rhodesiae]|uniref:aminotransferase class I/II-fold pyridoxal phosphate-dependent enzyme n=1 Tax=Pseudomonas TaxID=286 RepID=UPI001474643F|nr:MULTISPECIES: aminotransferase class I/II-fold pyridoxal phosphate-dependent enzyme [Pseudomonas]MBX4134998.1 aminotransferase class I/II-fold pyridoxal phosphate-dependent enzyme [Pseudomonas sp. S5F11]NMZ16927.1 aminotransferase class I/II-fold pyridoxal phosphate-dependent enzyme [Pseudomonas rhodesiae]
MTAVPDQKSNTPPANNFFARSSRGMADSYAQSAEAGADLSRLRVDSVGPQGAKIKHLPSAFFPLPEHNRRPPDEAMTAEDGVFVLCGCAYLSASFWPETIAAAHLALDSHGVGSYDSAPLSGETLHHEHVKHELQALYRPSGEGAAFLTISASMANITAIPMLVGQGDTIFADSESHMTLIQGCSLSKATVVRFRHGDMQDLEKKLQAADASDPYRSHRRLVVTDGIFSMSGHVCNLPHLVKLTSAFDCLLLVDEAHALGALGPGGRGTADYWGMDPACIDVITGTLAKAVGAQGGYIVCSEALAQAASFEYTTNRVFSSGVPASIAAAAAEVLQQINAASAPGETSTTEPNARTVENTFTRMYRQQRRNIDILRQYLSELSQYGFDADPVVVPGAIQRLLVGNEQALFAIQKQLYLRGVYVLGIVYPAVPKGCDQLRLTVMPSINEEQMHACGRAIVDVARAVMAEHNAPSARPLP